MAETVGITGTPGTGKKTITPLVALRLGFLPLDLNSVVLNRRQLRQGNTLHVDPDSFGKRLRRIDLERKVVFGHLLPYVFGKRDLDFVAVLRCDPAILKRRLLARGYSPEKIRENLEAELIGVVLDDCANKFGNDRVFECDTSRRKPEQVAQQVLTGFSSRRNSRRWIDWTLRYDSSRKLSSLFSTERTDPAVT